MTAKEAREKVKNSLISHMERIYDKIAQESDSGESWTITSVPTSCYPDIYSRLITDGYKVEPLAGFKKKRRHWWCKPDIIIYTDYIIKFKIDWSEKNDK